MVPSAELRVFQPLEAFPAEEQRHWERYILGGGMIRSPRPVYRQRTTGPRLGFLVPAGGEGAHVKLVDGTYYLCPLRTRMRALAGLLAFHEAKPFDGSEAFVADKDARRASKELSRMRRRNPGRVASIMQSPWHVPVRWFVLFDDEERRITERDGRHRLSYLTTLRKATRRVERAIPALRRSDLGPVAEMIVELHQWLFAFDPRALVELDYEGLCDFMTWDELDDDHSARDIQEAVKALSSEEIPRSAELYQAVIARWAEVRNHESLN
jgi:hypothetical protein